ncbi:MAG TPA: hypothetical protein VFL78_06020 [Rhodanobacteraceae bacterium]|nr:hypothetical protein [Rhodanobacteraceae bacterium]
MRYLTRLVPVLVAGLMLSACAGKVRTYVDTQYHHADWDSIQQTANPVPVNVTVQFQENGKAKPSVDDGLKTDVENTLRRSHVFMPASDDMATGTLTVVANNLAAIANAKHQGRHAALSFGSANELVRDNYVFKVTYKSRDGQQFQHTYNHRLVSAFGDTKVPKDLSPATLSNGFQQVVRDVMLNFIQDWQNKRQVARSALPHAD